MNKKSNKSACGFIYKMRIQKALAYRFDVFANIIFQCIAMFATAFFWKAIYSGYDSVQGAGVDDMLTYTVVSAVMSILFATIKFVVASFGTINGWDYGHLAFSVEYRKCHGDYPAYNRRKTYLRYFR